MFIHRMIKEFGVSLDTPGIPLLCDNQQTIGLLNKDTAMLSTRLRHVDIHNHWLRERAQAGDVTII